MLVSRFEGIVTPCVPKQEGFLSHGFENGGYTLCLSDKPLKIPQGVADPASTHRPYITRGFHERTIYIEKEGKQVPFAVLATHLEPLEIALCVVAEYITCPPHLKGRITGKSTYAREGLHVNATPVESGWRGYLTIELFNQNRNDNLILYANRGLCQIEFEQVEDIGAIYNGNYQDQPQVPIRHSSELACDTI